MYPIGWLLPDVKASGHRGSPAAGLTRRKQRDDTLLQRCKVRWRNSRFWPITQRYRACRFEDEYRRRRDDYQRQLDEQGLVYDEQQTIAAVRRRLADRGYTPAPKPLGQVHTFAAIAERSWHPTLLQTLSELGPVTNCDHEPFGLNISNRRELARRRQRFNKHLLQTLAECHARQPFDWVFVYGGGRSVTPQTIQRIHEEFGIPTVNMCLDDKNCWSGAVIDGVNSNQKDIASAYDLVWTSASVACNWYLAEGGRAIYLPEGCDPTEYFPRTDGYDIGISFMGACYGARPVVVRHLKRHDVPITVYGKDWIGSGRFEGSPADLFSRSQINFGIGGIAFSEQLTNVKGRDFDVPCTGGGMYLTAFNPDLARSFDIGREMVCYRNLEEAVELAHHYLKRPDECRAIAEAGRLRCLAEHTWRHRYLTLLGILGITPAGPAATRGSER